MSTAQNYNNQIQKKRNSDKRIKLQSDRSEKKMTNKDTRQVETKIREENIKKNNKEGYLQCNRHIR